MKNKLKQVLAMAMCFALFMSFAVPAMAQEEKAEDTITVVRNVTTYGEIIDCIRVNFGTKIDSIDDAKVFALFNENETEYEREIVSATLSEDGMSAEFNLVPGGAFLDPFNHTDYSGYRVEVGGRVIDKVVADISPDVEKFEAVTYSTPEYTYGFGENTVVMDHVSARYFVPDSTVYEKPEAGYPMVIWFHGAGETGDDNLAQITASNVPIWTEKETQDIFGGAYIVAPQNIGFGENAPQAAMSFIEQFLADHTDIDTDRIYVGGCSMGGEATWRMIQAYPDFFAAAFPSAHDLMEGVSDEDIENWKDLPIYMVISTGDNNRPMSTYNMIATRNRLRAAGSTCAYLTLFEHCDFIGQETFKSVVGGPMDHWSWVYVHDNFDGKGDDFDGMYWIDTDKDATYTYERIGVVAEVKDGVLTFNYTDKETEEVHSISLEGKNDRPEDAGYATLKEWIAAQSKSKKAEEPTFVDVTEDMWFAPAVKYVTENGIMKGEGDGHFNPDVIVTRGMVATTLYRMAGEPEVSAEQKFTDEGSTWYTDAVKWAAECGILAGYGDGTAKPEQNITREEMVTMLYRYAKHIGAADEQSGASLDAFPDAGEVSDFAEEAMSWAVGAKLVQGDDGKLDPEAVAPRAHFAELLMKFHKTIAE